MRAILFQLALLVSMVSYAQDTLRRQDYFETDRFLLSDTSAARLRHFLVDLKGREVQEIRMDAFCDDRASENYNYDLASRRATTMAKAYREVWPELMPGQIVVDELGELKLNGSDTVANRASNRRVESMIILKPSEARDEFSNLKVGDKIILKNLLFIGGRHFLLPESKPYLDSLVLKVKQYKQYKFRINGHICCQPPGVDGLDWDTKKRNLSVARAQMIYEYLIHKGISANRLEYVGHGSNFKLGKGDKYDRRVEIEVVGLLNGNE